jgi:hypothetical protein
MSGAFLAGKPSLGSGSRVPHLWALSPGLAGKAIQKRVMFEQRTSVTYQAVQTKGLKKNYALQEGGSVQSWIRMAGTKPKFQ